MKNIPDLLKKKDAKLESVRQILDVAEASGRKLTMAEEAQYKTQMAEVRQMSAEIDEEQAYQARALAGLEPTTPVDGFGAYLGDAPNVQKRTFGVENLRELRGHLAGGHADNGVTFGDLVHAVITGKGRPEARQMIVGDGASGGYLVPDQLFAELFAEAMGQARVIQAGARIVRMDYMSMRLPKISGYPQHEWLSELAPAEPSVFVFDKTDLKAEKCSIQTDMSVELFEDAAQFTEELNAHMRRAIALAIDHASLNGAAGGPVGLLNEAGVQRLADVGELNGYAPFSEAWGLVESANYSPSALLMHPWAFARLDALTAGTDGQPLQSPPSWNTFKKLTTTQLELDDAYEGVTTPAILGDWRQLIWAIRTDAKFEVSRTSVNAWRQYGVNLRIYWRGNVAPVHPRAFCIIPGIGLPELPAENGYES